MSKEQIEEMARAIMDTPPLTMQILGRAQGKRYMTAQHLAEHLHAQGYRKQSEWISVEERLPPVNSTVLIYTSLHTIAIWHYIEAGIWVTGQGYEVTIGDTHWMPLPEPPKMKGGEE